MKVVFTICSNNYLAQASVLVRSIKKNLPGYKVFIGLVDEISLAVDYNLIDADEIIPISELNQYNIQDIVDKYNIIELNTAVKPFFFQFFISRYSDVESIYYFDPDTKLYSVLDGTDTILQTNGIVLTPHICTPIEIDEFFPKESTFLNYGIYNLGFIGVNPKHESVLPFLKWWGDRTFQSGYDDVCNGLFVDQLWINLVPILFKGVVILNDKGMNMAPWNLHEREISLIDNNKVLLKTGEELRFYHFSSYNYKLPQQLSKHYDRYNFYNTGSLIDLYKEYHEELISNGIEKYVTIKCAYIKPPNIVIVPLPPPPTLVSRAKGKLKRMLGIID